MQNNSNLKRVLADPVTALHVDDGVRRPVGQTVAALGNISVCGIVSFDC